MRKLQALTKALKDAGVSDDTIYSFADQGVLTPTGKDLGHGFEVGFFKYDAVIQVESYEDDAYSLLAFITTWLQMNDPDREDQGLADPNIDISLNDNSTADVELAVEFEESLQIVPDESGPIMYDGQQYKVADVPIDVAEGLDNMEGGTDAK
ncbi:MAG: phage tail protein [Pseudodesulfovibrio sp.]|nr:phage tail protein [Pseudodesulfovibrio sp.]